MHRAQPEYLVAYGTQADAFRRELRRGIFVMLAASALLVLIATHNYLFFHVLAEFFAVGVAIIMFVVAWHTYGFSRNHYLMYLGCGYFWIGWLDVAHTLLYFGMPTALDRGNFTSQFWITTRFLEALLLLSAPLFMDRALRRGWTFGLFGALAGFCALLILGGHMPATFVEGVGLTRFKVVSEYVIVALLLAAMAHLWRRRALIEARIYRLVLVSTGLTIGAELAFTFYVGMYDLSNLLGHVFKLFSFWLVYVAIIRTTLAEPFAVMARGSSTYNAVPDPTLLVGRDGIMHQVNRAACRETGLGEAELLGRHCHELFHPPDTARDECPLCRAIAQGDTLPPLELPLGGKRGWRQFTLTPALETENLRASVQVSSDISQRKAAEAALLRSNTELRQYAGIAAHQLQEPLRSIASYTQLLSKRYQGRLDADADEFIAYAVAGATRLQRLLQDLLTYSQVGGEAEALREVDCDQALDEVARDLQPRLQGSGALVRREPLPKVQARYRELCLVFRHLLSNALDFAGGQAPRVEISAEREGAGWRLRVRDHGIGIAPRHHERIFGLFTRLQGAEEGKGTGIGLALCKKIVEGHGGRIWVESTEGQGADFYFTLPQ